MECERGFGESLKPARVMGLTLSDLGEDISKDNLSEREGKDMGTGQAWKSEILI